MTCIKLCLSFYGWMTWMRPRSVPFLTLVRPWGHQTPMTMMTQQRQEPTMPILFFHRGCNAMPWLDKSWTQVAKCKLLIYNIVILLPSQNMYMSWGDWNYQWSISTYMYMYIYKVPFRQTMHKTPQARCLNRGNELAKIGKIALIDLLSHFFTLYRKGIRQKLSSTGNDLPHSSLLPALPSCQDARPRVQSICWFISVKV